MKCPKCNFENPPDSHFCSKCGTQIQIPKVIPSSRTETLKTLYMRELPRGTTFAGRYEIIEVLGRGGMGKVYRVVDKKIEEQVALKLLRPDIADDEKTIERFRNELKIARKITHKNVCRMYDLSEEEGTLYITMEYVPGEDLKTLIRRIGKFTIGKAIFITRQVCEGLAEAHSLGVVHRDLKPQNIMIDKEGNAHIMDFGIARSLKTEGVTDTGVVVGTPQYMSPEQVGGKKVDQRSDIYSLGVIIYEMVTGRVPFDGETSFIIALKHKNDPPPDPREFNAQIPEEVSQVILKCMEKDKPDRYQGADELLTELKKIEEDLPTTDRVLPEVKTKPKIKRKRFRPFMVPVILLFAAIIFAGGYFFYEQVLQKGKMGKEAKPAVITGQTTQKASALAPQSGFIDINSTPEGAEVYIDDKREGITPFKRELPPGTYQVKIKKDPDYIERTDALEVKAGETSSKNYTLNPLKPQPLAPQSGYIEINSTPSGAEVYLGDKREGMTPLKRELNPGTYRIRIKKDPEYKEKTDVLNLKAGKTLSRNYTLDPVYILNVNTIPEGADVRVDDTYKGKTPIQIELSRSTCRLRIERGKGWSSIDESLTLKPGINSLHHSLKRIMYSLFIKTDPPGARVFIGDKSLGISPVKKSDLFGNYNIKIEKKGYKAIEESINIESDIEKTYNLERLKLVKIRLKVQPYADVFIDGKLIGEVPPTRIQEVTEGKHTIEFVSTALNKRFTVEVEIKAGESKEIRMNMETGKSQVVKISLEQ